MRLSEVIVESEQLNELSWQDVKQGAGKVATGVGKTVGATARGAGAVAGGIAGIPGAFKQGFQRGKATVQGTPQQAQQPVAQQAAPVQQQAPAGASDDPRQQQQEPGATNDPNQLKQNIKYHKDMAAELEKQLSDIEKQPAQEPAAQQAAPAQQPAQQSPADIRQQKQANAAKVAQDQMAANPAPTQQPPAPTAAPADKMNPDQVAAKKAELKGRRQAGTSTATAGGSGFKDYVGGSGERFQGADAQGNPVFKKINRESVEFHSRFLGMVI